MATISQIRANRENAQKSTGPRSAEGKAATRFNALQFGIHAESLVLPGEDAEALAELAREYSDQFRPVGPIEEALFDTIVHNAWNQRRYPRIEAEILTSLINAAEPSNTPLGDAFIQDAAGPDALTKLFRRQQAAIRDWRRAIGELQELQAVRPHRPKTDSQPAKPAPPPQPAATSPVPPPIPRSYTDAAAQPPAPQSRPAAATQPPAPQSRPAVAAQQPAPQSRPAVATQPPAPQSRPASVPSNAGGWLGSEPPSWRL